VNGLYNLFNEIIDRSGSSGGRNFTNVANEPAA
jgi:hypothetical protein